MLPVRRCTHSGITGPGTLLPTLRVPLAAQECSPSTRFYGIPKTYARRFEVVDLARTQRGPVEQVEPCRLSLSVYPIPIKQLVLRYSEPEAYRKHSKEKTTGAAI